MAPKARSKTTKQKEQKERMRRRREEEKMKSMQESNSDFKTEQYQDEYQKSKSEQNSKSKQYQSEYQKSKSVQYQKSKSEQYQKSKSEQYQNEYQKLKSEQTSKSKQYQNEYQKSKSEQFQNKCQIEYQAECKTEVEIDLSEGIEMDLSFKADLTDVSKLNFSVSEDIINQNCQTEGCLNSELRSSFYVQGSFHQGSPRFGINAGKQCVGNCLAAVIHGKVKSLHEWRPIDLDTVLIEGNDIYTLIHGDNLYLCAADLPEYIEMGNKLIHCNKTGSINAFIGEVDVDFESALPLDQALQYALTDSDNCFVTVRATTSVIIRQHQKLYVFDSHAKNSLGLTDCYGSSLLLELSDMHAVYQHFCNFVQNDKSVPFDLTGMKVSIQAREMNELSLINNRLGITNEVVENMIEVHSEQEQEHVTENLDEAELIKDGKMLLDNGLSSQEMISVDKSRVDTGSYCIQNETFSDVEIEGISNEELFNFKPTDMKLRDKLCRILTVPRKHVSKGGNCTSVLNMASPLKTKSIQDDGNCLFRAISYAVSQRQEYHSKVRAAIVQHIVIHKEKFLSFTSPFSVEEHIASNKMTDTNSWRTAVEIIAAADLLQTDIFTYTDGKWIKYSARQIKPDCAVSDKAIYLKHYGNHYEVVTDIGQKCLDTDCIPGDNRKRKIELEYPAVAKKSKKVREKEEYHTDPELRESILLKKREKYAEVLKRKLADKYAKDEYFRESSKTHSKFKYKTDETYRTNIKNASVGKYAVDEAHRQRLKDASARQYASDETHRQKKKDTSFRKYTYDAIHRQKVKCDSVNKYATVDTRRQKVKYDSVNKYATNEAHRQKVKYDSVNKYATNATYRQKVKYDSVNKYANDESRREKIKEQNRERCSKKKEKFKNIDNVIDRFRLQAKKRSRPCMCVLFQTSFRESGSCL